MSLSCAFLPRLLARFRPRPRETEGWRALVREGEALSLWELKPAGPEQRPELLRHVHQEDGQGVALAARLRRIVPLAGRYVLLLNPADYQWLLMDSPPVPEEELHAALGWQIRESLLQPLEETRYVLLSMPAPGRSRPPVVVVAAARSLLQGLVQEFQRARILIQAIDVPEMALRNLAVLYEAPPRGLALLHFDEQGGLLVITHGGELVMARRLDVRVSQWPPEGEARWGRLERLGLELQRSLDHFDRQFSQIPLSRLLVSVEAGNADLVEYLASNLYLPVEPLDLARVIDGLEHLERPPTQAEILAMGAALRGEGP
jgi:MSHA biogenesis protein MshI